MTSILISQVYKLRLQIGLASIREIGIWHKFSTMKIGRNVKDRKNGVVSLVTRHYFSKMAANLHIMWNAIGISHYFSKMAALCLSLKCSCITPFPHQPHSPHTIPQNPTPPSCQTSVYVIILIVLLTSHDCLGDGRQNGQVTEQLLTADCVGNTHSPQFGRTHSARLASAPAPASVVPTRPVSGTIPPPPRLGSVLPATGPKGKHIHGRWSIYALF